MKAFWTHMKAIGTQLHVGLREAGSWKHLPLAPPSFLMSGLMCVCRGEGVVVRACWGGGARWC